MHVSSIAGSLPSCHHYRFSCNMLHVQSQHCRSQQPSAAHSWLPVLLSVARVSLKFRTTLRYQDTKCCNISISCLGCNIITKFFCSLLYALLVLLLLQWQDFETRWLLVVFWHNTMMAVSIAVLTCNGPRWSRSYAGELTTTSAGGAACTCTTRRAARLPN